MSAGDSITSGLGARWSFTRPTLFVYEDCGVSFGTGGDEDTISIAKLIEQKWKRKIVGKSYGSRRVNLCIDKPANRVFCPTDPVRLRRKDDGYNVAMTGSTSEALPLQLTEITKRVEEDKDSGVFPPSGRILFTLLIGSNDLCMWDCRRPETQLNSFRTHVTQFIGDILGYFGEERIDVLVAEIPALEGVPVRANGTVMEPFAVLECPCSYRNNPTYSFASRIELYNQVLRSIPSIKLTDALRREKLKDWPPEMTSKLDAFHPSKWAHGYFGKMIFDDHVKEVA